ncbi:MAG: formylglycine-generating enzyme family protein, partial [Geminicoccaceae bacterium]
RDCPECPEMVVVPAGEFIMGAPPGEPGRFDDEGPLHKVMIPRPFAVGRYEVRVEEWNACAAVSGCNTFPLAPGWASDNRPVIKVNWYEAQEYVSWLSQRTGESYRLLSEAEWEYVARAGAAGAFWWGRDIGRDNANCHGCGSQWDNEQTAPVGSFPANAFGLHDTAGNVWEWIEDCWHDSYQGAPGDGSAWTTSGDCDWRVLRGGSWNDEQWVLRSALRDGNDRGHRSDDVGFRVARAID